MVRQRSVAETNSSYYKVSWIGHKPLTRWIHSRGQNITMLALSEVQHWLLNLRIQLLTPGFFGVHLNHSVCPQTFLLGLDSWLWWVLARSRLRQDHRITVKCRIFPYQSCHCGWASAMGTRMPIHTLWDVAKNSGWQQGRGTWGLSVLQRDGACSAADPSEQELNLHFSWVG